MSRCSLQLPKIWNWAKSKSSPLHEQSTNHISLIKQAQMLCKVTHCTGRILVNTRPHGIDAFQLENATDLWVNLLTSGYTWLLRVLNTGLAIFFLIQKHFRQKLLCWYSCVSHIIRSTEEQFSIAQHHWDTCFSSQVMFCAESAWDCMFANSFCFSLLLRILSASLMAFPCNSSTRTR